jgi:predicted RNase H-like HicB family nuclease
MRPLRIAMTSAKQMQLSDYLRIPYLLEARLAEASPGVWVNHVSYPELPGCTAEAQSLESALRQLERQRIVAIIRMLDDGRVPPVPRPPLASSDPIWIAEQSDVPPDILARIQRPT